MTYALYLGCVAEDSCKELGISMELVAEKIGMKYKLIEDATCCSAGYLDSYNKQLSLFMNGRTLALAEKEGADTIITICSLCLLALKKVNKELSTDSNALKKTNELLKKVGLQYSGKLKVKHMLEVLFEDYGLEKLSKIVTKPLGLNVAPFYSCQLIRPTDINDFDSGYEPRSLDDLIKALGGRPVDYPGKTKCCGFHILMVNEELAMKMGGGHLKEAKDRGADCVVTPCPCCHLVFDMYQPRIEKKLKIKLKLPILHLPQLIGLAMGFTPKQLGMKRHIVDATKLDARRKVAGGSE